jgi:hypothetical protein
MNKLTTLTIIAGLATALTTLAPVAAVVTHVPRKIPEANVPYNCEDEMGHMRSVSTADIAAIHGQHVTLIAVCEDLTVAGKDNYGPLFVNGNAERLRLPIARNATLMGALLNRSYDQNDVVSVRFGGGDSIILYVYQRDMN